MIDIIIETLIDSAKLLPFLFLTFLLMEYFEHKLSKKSKKVIEKSGKFGPVIGSLLGIVPQCGFSVSATHFYAARIISLGTLISIYLSTSDEMLPVLISHNANGKLIATILIIKVIIGIVAGILIDLFFRKRKEKVSKKLEICEDEHCHCENSILKSAIKHTFNILFFIVLISFVLNIIVHYGGEKLLSTIFFKDSIFGPFIGGIVGLIPNCAASVVLTELYIGSSISFGTMIAGLLAGSGVALLVLFKVNKNLKENLYIIALLYLIGVISGIIIDLLGVL